MRNMIHKLQNKCKFIRKNNIYTMKFKKNVAKKQYKNNIEKVNKSKQERQIILLA